MMRKGLGRLLVLLAMFVMTCALVGYFCPFCVSIWRSDRSAVVLNSQEGLLRLIRVRATQPVDIRLSLREAEFCIAAMAKIDGRSRRNEIGFLDLRKHGGSAFRVFWRHRTGRHLPLEYSAASAPLWFPMAILSPIPLIGILRGPYRRHRRRKKGLCLKCGYNLTGNVSGVCPECGEKI